MQPGQKWRYSTGFAGALTRDVVAVGRTGSWEHGAKSKGKVNNDREDIAFGSFSPRVILRRFENSRNVEMIVGVYNQSARGIGTVI